MSAFTELAQQIQRPLWGQPVWRGKAMPHTPGPWHMGWHYSKHRRDVRIFKDPWRPKATIVAVVNVPPSISEWNNSPFHANARLIVMAPLLYAALEEIASGKSPENAARIAASALSKVHKTETPSEITPSRNPGDDREK